VFHALGIFKTELSNVQSPELVPLSHLSLAASPDM